MASFAHGTRVLMSYGRLRTISDVRIDEKVICHDGMPHRVASTSRRTYSGPLVAIRSLGVTVRCTPDVMLYTCRRLGRGPKEWLAAPGWTAADALRPDLHMLVAPPILSNDSVRRAAVASSCGFDIGQGARAVAIDQVVDQPCVGTGVYNLGIDIEGTMVVEHFAVQQHVPTAQRRPVAAQPNEEETAW